MEAARPPTLPTPRRALPGSAAAVRFGFFFAQLAAMPARAWIVLRTAWH